MELVLAAPERLSSPPQLHEGRQLTSKNVGIDGFGQIVDRPLGVSPLDVLGIVMDGGDEDDRYLSRALPTADDGRCLEPVHLWHLNVEQNDRELLPEKMFE